MFCPGCGNADQQPESYCRQCGIFLPDLTKPAKQPTPPEQHVTANLILSAMTIVACFTLAILLYVMLGFRSDTHPLIYATAAVLIAMGAWHIQTFWRAILLRKHFKKMKRPSAEERADTGKLPADTSRLLKTPDVSDFVHSSVTEDTTRHLDEIPRKSS